MGNVLDTGANDEDLKWLSISNGTIFNDTYVSGVFENLPKFSGTEIDLSLKDGEDKAQSAVGNSKIKFNRISEVFSNTYIDSKGTDDDNFSTLDDILRKWSFATSNKMRARLLLRIHLALLREAESNKNIDDNLKSNLGVEYLSVNEKMSTVDDPDALLTASSVRMSLAMVRTLGPLKPELYRVVAEAMMDLFRRSTDLALSKVERGSLQGDTVRAIMDYATDMTKSKDGRELGPEDRAQALALMLAVAVTSGSVRDVLSVVISLQTGAEKLPPSAQTFLQRLRNLRSELVMSAPNPQRAIADFKVSVSPPIIVSDDQIDFASSCFCTDGSFLYLWDGVHCSLIKAGTGFHGTIEGGVVIINSDVEKQLRDRLKGDVHEEAEQSRAPVAAASDPSRPPLKRLRLLQNGVSVRTAANRDLENSFDDEYLSRLAPGFEADVLEERMVGNAGDEMVPVYRIEEYLWVLGRNPPDSGDDSDDSDEDGDHASTTNVVEIIQPDLSNTSTSVDGGGGGTNKDHQNSHIFHQAWLACANGKLFLKMQFLLGPYRLAVFSTSLKLEAIMDLELPIPAFMKMKKAWDDKRRGIESEEEEDPDEVEWDLGDEKNHASEADGAQVRGASTRYTSFDGQLEKNLLLDAARRAPRSEGDAEMRFVFEGSDTDQHIILDLGALKTPVKLGASFALNENETTVTRTFSVQVSVDGESYVPWGESNYDPDTVTSSPVQMPVLFPAPERYDGPPEIRYVKYIFGPSSNPKSGSAVEQLFAYARAKVKKPRREVCPALCSDGKNLIFLHAATLKRKDAEEKEAVLQAIVLRSEDFVEGYEVALEVDFQWGISDTQLFSCSFASNSEKVLVSHRKGFSKKNKGEKEAEFNIRIFDLGSGRQEDFSEVSFSKSKGFPNGLTYDSRNNIIWSWDCLSAIVSRWRNEGLAPRFRSARPTSSDPLLVSCPHCRLEALNEEEIVTSETEAAVILCELDRIANLYSPSPLSVAEPDVVDMLEVFSAGVEDPGGARCHIYLRGQPVGKNEKGFNLVVLNESLGYSDDRQFDTSDSERMADFIDGIPEGRVVMVATNETASDKLTSRAISSLRSLGADKMDKLSKRGCFAMIGRKGAAPGSVPQAQAEARKGPVTARQFLSAPRVPLAVETTRETLNVIVNLILLHYDKVKSGTASRLDKSCFLSCLRLLTANIFQLLRGTPVKSALEVFQDEDRKHIMSVVTELIEHPPETNGGYIIAKESLRVFTTSLSLLYPTVNEKCVLLVRYLDSFVKGSLSPLQRSVLEILLRQMSNPSSLSKLLRKDEDGKAKVSDEIQPSSLLESLLSIAKMEILLQIEGLMIHATDTQHGADSMNVHQVGEAAVQMLSALCNMMVSQSSQGVIVDNTTSFSDVALGKEKGKSGNQGELMVNVLSRILEASAEIMRMALNIHSQISRSSEVMGDMGSGGTVVMSIELEELLRISPLGTLLPVILNAVAQLCEHHGQRMLLAGLDSLSSGLSTCASLVTQCVPFVATGLTIVTEVDVESAKRIETFESAHPYASNVDSTTEVNFPGATKLTFVFDEQSKTENSYDYVKIWKNAEKSESWHPTVEKYSGRSGSENWPGFGGRPPLIIEGSLAYIEFHSDGSNEDWGWKVTVTGEFPSMGAVQQTHWLLQLDRQLGYCAAVVSSSLVRSVPIDTKLNELECSSWIEDELFSHKIVGLDEWHDAEYNFLVEIIDRPKASRGSSFILKMRSVSNDDVNRIDDINRATYSVFAALLKFTGLTSIAVEITDKIRKDVPEELVLLWKYSQKVRNFRPFLVNNAQPSSESKGHTVTPAGESKLGNTPTKNPIGTPGASVASSSVDPRKVFAEEVVQRMILLLRIEGYSSPIQPDSLKDFFDKKFSAQQAGSASDDSSLVSADGSLSLASIQSILSSTRFLALSNSQKSSAIEEKKSGNKSSTKKDMGLLLVDHILAFADSTVKSDQIESVRAIRDLRARYRIQGLEMSRQLLGESSPFALCSLLAAISASLRDSVDSPTAGSGRVHFMRSVQGCSPSSIRSLSAAFSNFLESCVNTMKIAIEKAKDETLRREDRDHWRLALIMCMKAANLDYDSSDHVVLQSSGLFLEMENAIHSEDGEVSRTAWGIIESLLKRCVIETSEHVDDEDTIGRVRLSQRLVSLFLAELQRTSTGISAQKSLAGRDEQNKLIPKGVDLAVNVVNCSSDSLGFAYPHIPLGLTHTFSLWIRRDKGANEEAVSVNTVKLGTRVMRGRDWPVDDEDGGANDNAGTVVAVLEDGKVLEVKWDDSSSSGKKYSFGNKETDEDEPKYEVEVADISIAGIVYQKGVINALEEKKRGDVWSSFGLQLRGNSTLRMFTTLGENREFIAQTEAQIAPDRWTHVAVVQNRDKCRIYVDGMVDVEKTLPNVLIHVGKSGVMSRVIESSHPYNDNMNEFTTIEIPGALGYTITFDAESKTEANYDYVVFYKDDAHTDVWGEAKYSGGRSGSAANWPGLAGRPPLKIPAKRFVLHFKSDGSNTDWGYRFTATAELQIISDANAEIIKVLNNAPFYIGQTPSYVTNRPSFEGSVCRFSVFDRALAPEDIHLLAANSPDDVRVVDDLECLDVLSMLQRCSDHLFSSPSAQRDSLGSEAIKPLLTVVLFGPLFARITALRLCSRLLPSLIAASVNSLFKDVGYESGSSATFVEYLYRSIGAFMNVWLRRGRDVAGQSQLRPCEDSGYALAMEQINLIRCLVTSSSDEAGWRAEVSSLVDRTNESVQNIIPVICSMVEKEKENRLQPRDWDEIDPAITNIFALVALIGGFFDGLRPGIKAGYRSSGPSSTDDDRGTLEDCVIIALMWPPVLDEDDDEDRKAFWGELVCFGEACVISLVSSPNKAITVPTSALTLYPEPLPSSLHDLLSTHADTIGNILSKLIRMPVQDPRPEILPIVKESEETLVFESDHPYSNEADVDRVVSLPGAKEIIITFDEQSRTEFNCDYVCFYKDDSKSAYWGSHKYSGRDGNQIWPGVGGTPPLVIPAESFILHFHSDGSDNDWGYKFTARASCVVRKEPPLIPPLITVALADHLKLLCVKAFHSILQSTPPTNLIRPALSLTPELLRIALNFSGALGKDGEGAATRPKVLESKHPYDHNADEYIPVVIKGAKRLVVTFDPQSATENGCDYLRFYKDNSRTAYWGENQYTGGKDGGEHNWPSLKGRPPLIIPASSFVLYFHSDGSVNAWGWKITVKGYGIGDEIGTSTAAISDSIRCMLQYLGEGPSKPVVPENINSFPSRAKSTADQLSAVLEDFQLKSLPLDTPSDSNHAGVEDVKVIIWPRLFVVNAQDTSEVLVYADKSQDAVLVGKVPSTLGVVLRADASYGDWLQVTYPNIPAVTPVSASISTPNQVVFPTTLESVVEGGTVSVMWNSSRKSVHQDWIGLYVVGAAAGSATPSLWWTYVPADLNNGTVSTSDESAHGAWTMPLSGTQYEFRYFAGDGYNLIGKSGPVSVTQKRGWVRRRTSDNLFVIPSQENNKELITLSLTDDEQAPDAKGKSAKPKHPMNEVKEYFDDSVSSGFVPSIPANILKGKVDRLERIVADGSQRAIATLSKDTLSAVVGIWPQDVPFVSGTFENTSHLLAVINAVFEKEFAEYDARNSSIDESKVIKNLKFHILKGVQEGTESAQAVFKCLSEYAFDVLFGAVANEKSLKPTRALTKSIECKHPYDDNMDEIYPISIPGAKWLKIVFDPRCSTEKDCDFVEIYLTAEKKDADKVGAKYTGRVASGDKLWAGVGSVAPLKISSDSCAVTFHSDGSNTDWGFKLTCFGIMEEPSDVEIAQYQKKKEVTDRKGPLACWLLSLLMSEYSSNSEAIFKSPAHWKVLIDYVEVMKGEQRKPAIDLLMLMVQVLSRSASSKQLIHHEVLKEVTALKNTMQKLVTSEYDLETESGKLTPEIFSPNVQLLTDLLVSTANFLSDYSLNSMTLVTDQREFSWVKVGQGGQLSLDSKGFKMVDGSVSHCTGIAQSSFEGSSCTWEIKFGALGLKSPSVGITASDASLNQPLEKGSSSKFYMSISDGRLHVKGHTPVPFSTTFVSGDVIKFFVIKHPLTVTVFRNQAIVGRAIGPVGSGAAVETTAAVDEWSPGVTLCNVGDSAVLSSEETMLDKERQGSDIPEWCCAVQQSSTLIRAAETNQIPVSALLQDFLPLCEWQDCVDVETSHPFDINSNFSRSVKISGAKKLRIVIEPATSLAPDAALKIFGSDVGSVAQEYVGLQGNTGDECRRGNSLLVGDVVVRGPDWDWGDVDGGAGGRGIVQEVRAWKGKSEKGVVVKWRQTDEVGMYRYNLDGIFDLKTVSKQPDKNSVKVFEVDGDEVKLAIIPITDQKPVELKEGDVETAAKKAVYGLKCVVLPQYSLQDVLNSEKYREVMARVRYPYDIGSREVDEALVQYADRFLQPNSALRTPWPELVSIANSEGKGNDLKASSPVLAKFVRKSPLNPSDADSLAGADEDDVDYGSRSADPWAWGLAQTKNGEGNDVHRGTEAGFKGTLYCGQSRDIPGTDGRCGPTNGANCTSCRALQLRKPPICGSNGCALVISSFSENGYTSGFNCDRCRKSTSRDNLGRTRWFCETCHYDLCFECHPQVPEPSPDDVTRNLGSSPGQVPLQCIQLRAAGQTSLGMPTQESLENLLKEGTESWNKWFHSGVSESWIEASFINRKFRITGYSLCSANDKPECDPVAWTLFGCTVSDGRWIALHSVQPSDTVTSPGDSGSSPPVPAFSSSARWQWLPIDLPIPSEPVTAVRLSITGLRGPNADGVQLGHIQIRGVLAKSLFQVARSALKMKGTGIPVPTGGSKPEAVRYAFLRTLNKTVSASLPLANLCTIPSGGSKSKTNSASHLSSARGLIFAAVKKPILDTALQQSLTVSKVSSLELKLSKAKAKRQQQLASQAQSQFVDGNGDENWSYFAQTFRILNFVPTESLRVPRSTPVFQARFEEDSTPPSENSTDIFNTYRKCFNEFAQELMSAVLPLLLPLPLKALGSTSHGHKNVFALNPAPRPTSLEMFVFLGKLIGIAIRTNVALPIRFAPLIWKLLVNEEVDVKELEDLSPKPFLAIQALKRLLSEGPTLTGEEFQQEFSETFSIVTLDGRVEELCSGGLDKRVNLSNALEYVGLWEGYRLREMDVQIHAIRRGLSSVIPLAPLQLFTGEQLRALVHGEEMVPIDFTEETKWIVKVVFTEGAKVRQGLELSTDVVHSVDFGATIEIFERRLNAESIPRFRTAKGWMSEMLNPAAGSVGPVAQIIPMRRPLRFRVTSGTGAVVRQQPDNNSPEVSRLDAGETVDIADKLFSADSERWLRLLDESGYVWWGNAAGDNMALSAVGLAPLMIGGL